MDGDNLEALRNALAQYMAKAGGGKMMSPKAAGYMGGLNERIGNYDQMRSEVDDQAQDDMPPEGGDMDMEMKEQLMQEMMRRGQRPPAGQGGGMPMPDAGYRPQRR